MTTANLYAPTSSEAARYRAILDKKIAEGAARASKVIETIHRDVPTDAIVPTGRVRFAATDTGIVVQWGDVSLSPSDHALGQLSEKASSPTAYVRECSQSRDAWRRDLAVEILGKSYANLPRERVLARSVRGQLRGWQSDKYRRLDSRPLVDSLAKSAQSLGAIPIDGTATETRVALKVMYPEIIEPVPGDFMVLGLEWSNSDFGNGAHSIREFALRVACLNGMTRENVMRQIHIGGKLSDNIEFSDRTLKLDTQASVSAMQDVVRGVLGPAGRSKLVESIRAANEKAATAAAIRGALKAAPKSTVKAAVDAFESEDVINLPAGETAWRASNAISWVARHTDDAELRLDLERAAGAIVN